MERTKKTEKFSISASYPREWVVLIKLIICIYTHTHTFFVATLIHSLNNSASNTYAKFYSCKCMQEWKQNPEKIPGSCNKENENVRPYFALYISTLFNIFNPAKEFSIVKFLLHFLCVYIIHFKKLKQYMMISSMDSQEVWELENGGRIDSSSKEIIRNNNNNDNSNEAAKTTQIVSTPIMRKKSDPLLVSNVRFRILREFLANLREVILGTRLALLFPAVPLAVIARLNNFGRVSAHIIKK